MAMIANQILEYALQNGASDVILVEGSVPSVRLGRRVGQIPEASVLPVGFLDEFLGVLPESAGVRLIGPLQNAMWRVRYSRGALGKTAILRPLLNACPDFNSLGVPATLQNLLSAHSGLILFCGPAASGKTTTASAFVSAYCSSAMRRAVFLDSLEEYQIPIGDSIVIRTPLNENPSEEIAHSVRAGADLLWFGDVSEEAFPAALRAAESGALVVATLTAATTAGALAELLQDATPAVRTQFASNLRAIVVQHLLPSADGNSMIPVWEIVYGNQSIAMQIRSGDFYKVKQLIQQGSSSDGTLPLDASLAELLRHGYIQREEAEKIAFDVSRLG